jgi:hypothetical protein
MSGGSSDELRSVVSQSTSPQVILIRDQREMSSYLPAIEELAMAAAEPNVFYEPWMLLPAIDSFGHNADLFFLLVYSNPGAIPGPPTGPHRAKPASGGKQLLGFFPLERSSSYRGLPLSVLRLWRHHQSALCTPLIRCGFATEVVASFLDWALSDRSRCHLIEFGLISGEGDFATSLKRHLSARSIRHFKADWFNRALFEPAADADAYLRQAKDKRHRKDIARREARLATAGRMEYACLTNPAEIDAWTDSFLELEARGWKGRSKSALACVSGGRAFLTSIAKEAFARNRLMMLAIKLDGVMIASKLNLIAGSGSFAFKIAFDEAYAEFSPGLLLEVENIRSLHRMPDLQWMDSCAAPRHPMIDHLWPGRRAIETIVIPGGRKYGSLILAAFPLLREIKQRLRRAARMIRTTRKRTA